MNKRDEKTLGVVLMLFGISMWQILPDKGFPFTTVLIIHMSLVIPGVYLFEKPFIKYVIFKIRKKKK
jgi:hypothetical protein